MLSKNVNNTKCAPKLIFFNEKKIEKDSDNFWHGLRTPRQEIAFTARPKIQSQSQIFRYGGSTFCLPHRPNFSDIFDLCLHWVSVVRVSTQYALYYLPNFLNQKKKCFDQPFLSTSMPKEVKLEILGLKKILFLHFLKISNVLTAGAAI